MNHEITFRAWHEGLKRFFYYLPQTEGCPCWITNNDGGLVTCSYDLSKYELLEYIGLKDKNGSKIYEGDVLGWDNDQIDFPAGNGERMKVEWHKELARFGLSFYSNHGGEGYTGTLQNIHEYIQKGAYVIGNIYENSDLIS